MNVSKWNDMEWDSIVGHWIKDVPYMWKKYSIEGNFSEKERWKSYYRIYLLPFYSENINIVNLLRECDVKVVGYFRTVFTQEITLKNTDDVRVNGVRIFFPSIVFGDLTNIGRLYDYIGVPLPSEDKIKNFSRYITSEIGERTDIIDIPTMKTPTKGKYVSPTRSHFRDFIDINMWYLEIAKSHKNVCLPILNIPKSILDTPSSIIKVFNVIVQVFENDKKLKVYGASERTPIIRKCLSDRKIDYIFIPVSIQKPDEKLGHANLLILDKNNYDEHGRRSAYFFDPWGTPEFYISMEVDVQEAVIKNLNIGKGWNIVLSSEWCPYKSFQELDKYNVKSDDYEGYCAIWTLWLIETTISNPNIPLKNIIRIALHSLSKNNPDFRRFIRNYSKHKEESGMEMLRDIGVTQTEFDKDIPLEEDTKDKLHRYIVKIAKERY